MTGAKLLERKIELRKMEIRKLNKEEKLIDKMAFISIMGVIIMIVFALAVQGKW